MKIEVLKPVTVAQVITFLQQFNQDALVVINASGSSSFSDDGIIIEDIDTDPPEVSIGADF